MELLNSIVKMKPEDLVDSDILQQKQEQINDSLIKFKKHFEKNLDMLNQRELKRDVSPKFTICFIGLATFMGISLKPLLGGGQDEAGTTAAIQSGAVTNLNNWNSNNSTSN